MQRKDQKHILVVEAYEGLVEFLSDESAEQRATIGLGLPLEEIAEQLDCRVTVLGWDEWYCYEAKALRVQTPATQPISIPDFSDRSQILSSARVKRVAVPTREPDYGTPFAQKGLSPRSHGLINDSGLLFFVSCCLNQELQALYQQDPFQAVILPMWGGLGYVAQMAKATLTPNRVDVPFGVVVTDTSANRQSANQEGVWTRHAIVRRQMEDISLALADLALVFGSQGEQRAVSGRLPEASPPVVAPRRVEAALLDAIAQAAQTTQLHPSVHCLLYEPQQVASGVLSALDAVALLANQGIALEQPVISAGPPTTFAPMKPRDFVEYWSSRGFVRELVRDRQWEWQREYPRLKQSLPIRLYPSFFEHLPHVWSELAQGSLVLLSAAAAEGLAPGQTLPQEVLIKGEPTPENLAECLKNLVKSDTSTLEQIRQKLCQQVVTAHRGEARQSLLQQTVAALDQLLQAPPPPQDLSRVSLLFSDRRLPLQVLAEADSRPPLVEAQPGTSQGTLSVVVTCYEMGTMLREAVESVWAAEYCPDEVLLIDDGSSGSETLTTIQALEQQAMLQNLPLKVIRKRNGGLAAARNTGLEAATGEFISFLDGDDLIEPPFYRLAVQLLQQYPHLGGVAAWAAIFGTGIPDGFWNAPQTEFPFLLTENSVIVPCVTRTALLRQLGGYDVQQRYNYEDWELSIRMLAAGWPIVTIPLHLVKYRVRLDSLYRSMTAVQNQVMRELLLTHYRELVGKFAVEIAMQLEHQLKQFVYPEEQPLPYLSLQLQQLAEPQPPLSSFLRLKPLRQFLSPLKQYSSRLRQIKLLKVL